MITACKLGGGRAYLAAVGAEAESSHERLVRGCGGETRLVRLTAGLVALTLAPVPQLAVLFRQLRHLLPQLALQQLHTTQCRTQTTRQVGNYHSARTEAQSIRCGVVLLHRQCRMAPPSVCLLVTSVSCAKTDEPIEMLFVCFL